LTTNIRNARPWRHRLSTAVLITSLIAAPAVVFGQSAGHEYTVEMRNMDYGAVPSKLKVGDTINWVNRDTVVHSVTARDHSFDVRINPGQSAKMPLNTAGRIPFYCLFHPQMRGTLTVASK